MKKQIMALIVGSVMSAAAFAAEPAATPKVLSDIQMELVTAGTGSSKTITIVDQYQKNTNVAFNPTAGLNVAVLTFGGKQNVGGNNTQSAGGIQVVK